MSLIPKPAYIPTLEEATANYLFAGTDEQAKNIIRAWRDRYMEDRSNELRRREPYNPNFMEGRW